MTMSDLESDGAEKAQVPQTGSFPGTWRIFLPACSPDPGPGQAQAGERPPRAEEPTSVQPIYADVPLGQFSSCFWRAGWGLGRATEENEEGICQNLSVHSCPLARGQKELGVSETKSELITLFALSLSCIV